MSVFDLRNCDCMELMRQFPDKHFELAIVDPPYGMDSFIAVMLVFVSFQVHSIMLELIEIHGSIRRIRK